MVAAPPRLVAARAGGGHWSGPWCWPRAQPWEPGPDCAPARTRSSHTLTFNYFGKNRNCPWFSPGAVCRARLSVTRYVYISNISCILVLLIWLLHYTCWLKHQKIFSKYATLTTCPNTRAVFTTRVTFIAPHYTCLTTLHVSHCSTRVSLHLTLLRALVTHCAACLNSATSSNTVVSFNFSLLCISVKYKINYLGILYAQSLYHP